jgi:iron(III) transport system substrate-binding protein
MGQSSFVSCVLSTRHATCELHYLASQKKFASTQVGTTIPDRQVFKTFSENTGIKVRLIEATGITLIERLKREGNNSNADIILLVDSARINNAAKEGLLAPIESEQIKKNVPARYRDPSNRWFGLTRRVRAIIVNPKLVDPNSIKTYADLAKSKSER